MLVRSICHTWFWISSYGFYYCASFLVLGIISAWKQQKCWNYFLYILGYCLKQVGMCCVNDSETRSWELTREFTKVTAAVVLSAIQGNQKGLNVRYSHADASVGWWCQMGVPNTLFVLTKVPPSVACMSVSQEQFPCHSWGPWCKW